LVRCICGLRARFTRYDCMQRLGYSGCPLIGIIMEWNGVDEDFGIETVPPIVLILNCSNYPRTNYYTQNPFTTWLTTKIDQILNHSRLQIAVESVFYFLLPRSSDF
jgi:hypothetical protein